MAITARTRLGDLLEDHPDVDEVFENYGVEITDDMMAMTLHELCKAEALNYWELKSDIVEAAGWDGSATDDDEDEDFDEDELLDDELEDEDDDWDDDLDLDEVDEDEVDDDLDDV